MIETGTSLVLSDIEVHAPGYYPKRSIYQTLGGRQGTNVGALLAAIAADECQIGVGRIAQVEKLGQSTFVLDGVELPVRPLCRQLLATVGVSIWSYVEQVGPIRAYPDADVVVFGHSHIPWNETDVRGEAVPAHVDEAFDIAFIPEPQVGGSDEEIELHPAECDVVFHDGVIDRGTAATARSISDRPN